MTTAILAVQGAFAEHAAVLESLGEKTVLLRGTDDLDTRYDRLILPGGESTVQAKLLYEQGMLMPLRERIGAGMPVLGTCAGLILIAGEVEGDDPPRVRRLATMPVRVVRNAYGRQLGSFRTTVWFEGVGDVPATFIRAPQIAALGEGVRELAAHGGRTVAACHGNQIACTFHPELTADTRIHELFLRL